MGFFDKKEEVLDIELTQYGKYLLSKGKFTPVFYSFFDDDIIYDWKYAEGASEKQNYAETRILEETPSSRVQYVFSGCETKIREVNESVRQNEVALRNKKIQQTPERHYALSAPLGNSAFDTSYDPSWGVRAYLGKFNKIVNHQTGSQPTLKIPQLSMNEITYKTRIVAEADNLPDEASTTGRQIFQAGDLGSVGSSGELALASEQFNDGSYVQLIEDAILIEIEETNTPCLRENFDIEVFLIEEEENPNSTPTQGEKLIPLSFVKRYSNIRNGILLDDKDVDFNPAPEIDSSFVEHYFDIFVDKGIDTEVLCSAGVRPDTTRCGTFNTDWGKCPDGDGSGSGVDLTDGLYDSDATGPFGEDC